MQLANDGKWRGGCPQKLAEDELILSDQDCGNRVYTISRGVVALGERHDYCCDMSESLIPSVIFDFRWIDSTAPRAMVDFLARQLTSTIEPHPVVSAAGLVGHTFTQRMRGMLEGFHNRCARQNDEAVHTPRPRQ
jgi:hypothetical protein